METQYVPVQQQVSPEWLGMQTAARRIGISHSRMYQLVRAGLIPGVLTEIGWLFSPAEIDAYAERRKKADRIGRGYLTPCGQQIVKE